MSAIWKTLFILLLFRQMIDIQKYNLMQKQNAELQSSFVLKK